MPNHIAGDAGSALAFPTNHVIVLIGEALLAGLAVGKSTTLEMAPS